MSFIEQFNNKTLTMSGSAVSAMIQKYNHLTILSNDLDAHISDNSIPILECWNISDLLSEIAYLYYLTEKGYLTDTLNLNHTDRNSYLISLKSFSNHYTPHSVGISPIYNHFRILPSMKPINPYV